MIFWYVYWVDKVARPWKMEALACSFGLPESRLRGICWRRDLIKTSFWYVEPAVNRQPWLPPEKLVEHSLLASTWFLAGSCAPCTRAPVHKRTTHPRTRAPTQPRTRAAAQPHTRSPAPPLTRVPAHPRTHAPAHAHPRTRTRAPTHPRNCAQPRTRAFPRTRPR